MHEITFDDVIGLEDAKRALRERFEIYFYNKDIYTEANVMPPAGVLLFGPPGTGKTMLVKACYNTVIKKNPNFVFKIIRLSDFSSSNITGQTEKKVNRLFDRIRDDTKEWILVFDEIDAICPDRGRVTAVCTIERINAILQCLDGMGGRIENLFIIGTTNRLDKIDDAIKRSGRFDDIIEVQLPSVEESILHAKRCLLGLPIKTVEGNEKILGVFGYNSGWAGSEYTKFKAKILGEFILNGKTPLSHEQIVRVASRIKAPGKKAYPF